jgi:hypothetical protein
MVLRNNFIRLAATIFYSLKCPIAASHAIIDVVKLIKCFRLDVAASALVAFIHSVVFCLFLAVSLKFAVSVVLCVKVADNGSL